MYFNFNTDALPHISFMNRCSTGDDWIHPRRTASEFILLIIVAGEMYLKEDQKKYALRQGDYIFLQPGHTHVGYQPSQCEYYYIHFQEDCLSGWDCSEIPQIIQIITDNNKLAYQCDPFNEDLYKNNKLFVPKDRHIYLQSAFEQVKVIMDEMILLEKQQMPNYKLICSARFLEIMVQLSRDFVSHIVPDEQTGFHYENQQKIYSLIHYLQMNDAKHISGEDIAMQTNMNFDSFNRLFKRETGLTVFNYLKQIRLNHARELLMTSQLRLNEISERVGFCDQYYLSRVFKKEYGVSPKKYTGK